MENQVDGLMKRAEELADRPYVIEVYEDVLDSNEKIFFVKNPELRGCMAQGTSIEEAKEELREARVTYIHSLLLDNMQVPEPDLPIAKTAGPELEYSSEGGKVGIIWGDFEQVVEKVIGPFQVKYQRV